MIVAVPQFSHVTCWKFEKYRLQSAYEKQGHSGENDVMVYIKSAMLGFMII